MYLKTDSLGHHEIMDGDLDHSHLGWGWKSPFKAIGRGFKKVGHGFKSVASIIPQALASSPGSSFMNGDDIGIGSPRHYGFSGKKNGISYFRGKPLSPGWYLDKYGWPHHTGEEKRFPPR
jgi:hypothetical protein